jgi:hypothetical protein
LRTSMLFFDAIRGVLPKDNSRKPSIFAGEAS